MGLNFLSSFSALLVGLFIDGHEVQLLVLLRECFSALLVGLFIDGGRSHGITLAGPSVSVPFWLGCSLMDGTASDLDRINKAFQCPFGWAVH